MKACGIIVEYNPFHNGHSYHLQQSKKQTQSDCIIAVMSGNFLQRGEPAIISKWERAKTALMGGADLIIELPYLFAVSPAPVFAKAGVRLLQALRAEALCFGSESGNIDLFYHTISQLEKQKVLYDEAFQSYSKQGYSFPKASSLAAGSLSWESEALDLSLPNNILGMEYVRAMADSHAPMEAHTIKRIGASFHEERIDAHQIASATSIRKTLNSSRKPSVSSIEGAVPSYTSEALSHYMEENGQFTTWDSLFPLLRYKLLATPAVELRKLYEVEEGLEYRLKETIRHADSFHTFMTALKTKRYTWTRLQRMCLHILNHISRPDAEAALKEGPPYVRILGMSDVGQRYLNTVKKQADLPVLTTLSRLQNPLIELEQRVSAVYFGGYPQEIITKKIKEEYSTPPLRFQRSKGQFI
ncbi:nucleotidyltransferase [Fictibacillus fluitans]|uniref:tRNA(Met) cytidine acetate ligase n=1 Tax=Fictibacillus fluitans TaxID=3058422 RepID=A0ABT8HS08_9BACL|nr:nucleotidyltransferase [Fictibacillus sp. NE201]MDN4523534.1 nucleotidyltransferase [Fictibacillus sp. NE201]